MTRLHKSIDKQLQSVIGDGDVSRLPGAGSPLRLDDDCFTPADMRAANKIMRDHDVLPAWVQHGKALDEREAALRQEINDLAKRYLARKRAAHSARNASYAAAAEAEWNCAQAAWMKRLKHYNRDSLTHNLNAPRGMPHRISLHGEALIQAALNK